jgi:hypothetical protein
MIIKNKLFKLYTNSNCFKFLSFNFFLNHVGTNTNYKWQLSTMLNADYNYTFRYVKEVLYR